MVDISFCTAKALLPPPRPGTKAAKKAAVAAIIDRTFEGDEMTPGDLAEFNHLCGTGWLSARHATNPSGRYDPRYVEVFDGFAWTDFSWNRAVNPIKAQTKIKVVLRGAVENIVRAYRDVTDETECADAHLGGCNGGLQVDHDKVPFDAIAKEYLTAFGIPEITKGPFGAVDVFACSDEERRWIEFHQARATYRLRCGSHNASKGKRARS